MLTMSEPIKLALIGVLSSLIVSVCPIIIAIIQNRKKTESAIFDELDRMKQDQDMKNEELKQSIENVKDDVAAVSGRIEDHIKWDEESNAEQIRVRILRFDDELCDPTRKWPSAGAFQQANNDCDKYTDYFTKHPDFHNGIGEDAMKSIRSKYRICKDKNLFGTEKISRDFYNVKAI